MTEQQHPITPPPELMKGWIDAWYNAKVKHANMTEFVAIQAARWGADQELKECCDWLDRNNQWARCDIDELHDGRRPKPQSLKEQALEVLNEIESGKHGWLRVLDKLNIIRRALEQLDD